jgi:hypothetical protein
MHRQRATAILRSLFQSLVQRPQLQTADQRSGEQVGINVAQATAGKLALGNEV